MAGVAGTVGEALQSATDALRSAGVESPRLDTELLLAEATGIERAMLSARPEAPVGAAAGRVFGSMIRRRVVREPVAYILGRKGFRQIELSVDARALIPRPETEMLVELALEVQPLGVLDVGTGSGAIALAVADELPGVEVVGTDTSLAALDLARANAASLGLSGRVRFEQGTVPDGVAAELLLANLPYVTDAEIAGLAPEIGKFEPLSALAAGPDGLDAYRLLAPALAGPRWRTVGLEIGATQASAVAEIVREAGFTEVQIRPDLAGHDRVVVARRA